MHPPVRRLDLRPDPRPAPRRFPAVSGGWQDRRHARRARCHPLRRPAPALVRRPRRPGRRGSVPGERDAWARHPQGTPQGSGAALLPVRRGQPDQRPEPRPPGRPPQGLRGPRPGPAGLLGQPQLGPVPDGHPARDGRRRPPPHPGPRHQCLRLVLGLPPVPGEPRRLAGRPSDRGRRPPEGRQAAPLLQPPRLPGADDRRGRRVPRRPPRGRPGRRTPRLLDPLHPDRRSRQLRPGRGPRRRRGVRRRAPGRGPVDRRRRPRAHRRRPPLAARLPVPLRRPAHPVARARHLRPPGGAPRGRRPRGRHGTDRLRLRPHGGPLRPRHGGHGQGRRTGSARTPVGHRRRRSALRRRDPRTRPGARRCRERAAGHALRSGRSRRRSQPLPSGLLPGPRPRPAAAGADSPYA